MPHLEVRNPNGRTELRKLSRRNPIIIGRNPISDIHVDDESVAPIHCRVIWNGTAFEVAAVSEAGVDVNGTLVSKKKLSTGDVIRVGELDLVMLNGSGEVKRAPPAVAAVAAPPEDQDDDTPAASELGDDEWEILSAGEIEMPVYEPTTAPSPKAPAVERPASPTKEPLKAADDEPVLLDETPAAPATKAAKSEDTPAKLVKPWSGVVKTKRPGEQDVLTSPLVLGFGGLALALLLAAGAIWLLIGREGADRLYAAAVSDREAGRYAQAISGFEQFLLEYPTDKRAMDAKFALGLTRVERYAGGSAPDFEKALQEFDAFVRENRDASEFDSQKEPLRNLAQQIASGASATAIRTGERSFLAPATTARTLFDRYAPTDHSTDEAKATLAKEFAAAEAAVRKHEYFRAAATKIENAIAESDFSTAFQSRFDLLTRYPDLQNDRQVRALLTKLLEAEKKLVQPQATSAVPPSDDTGSQAALPTIVPIGHTQARAGEVSDGRIVYAVGQDAVFGLDAVTGRPKWRSPIGLDTPFFPVEINASVPALLTFDTTSNELVLLERENGATLWRTPAAARANGAPLVAQGQIDVATADGQLKRFDVESGRLLAAVAFPQNVVGPPVLSAERLIVFGERATAYTLDFRSLEIQAVSFVGHADGALDAPPQALGRLVMTFENDRQDAALVRAFTVDEKGTLKAVAAERVDGHVHQPAVARGNVLFVPSSKERIAVFSVSDDAGQPPMTRVAGVQIPDGKDVPTYLVPGPDGMLWAAGSALRKLRLKAEKFELQQGELAPGRHTQPPQQSGDSLFVARSLPSAPAVYVSQADREAMTGSWRTVIGAGIAGFAVSGDQITLVTSAGQSLTLSENDLAKGDFTDTRALPQWDEKAQTPLEGMTTTSGDGLVWREGSPPLSWRLRGGETPGTPRPLTAAPQCSPVRLKGGLVLPLAGRLEWLADASGPKVESFLLPVGGAENEPPRWQSLAALDDERFVAADERGTLRVMHLRQEPLPHLGEGGSVTLEAPLKHPLAVAGERIAIADGSVLRLLDPAGLRPLAESKLESPITGGPWFEDTSVFVETDSRRLFAFDAASLEPRWNADAGSPVADAPIHANGGWIVATQTGDVLVLSEDGQQQNQFEVRVPLSHLVSVGSQIVAIGLDGALHAIAPGAASAPGTTQ